ncbi:hypothetical protein HDU98_002846 [Podochytrium sp. JEL0797]|nr:hypothetical protein HDU98_002846 [Podochytrium sp. JEL0797]
METVSAASETTRSLIDWGFTVSQLPTPVGWAPGIPYPLGNHFTGTPRSMFPANAPPPPFWPANYPWPPAAVLMTPTASVGPTLDVGTIEVSAGNAMGTGLILGVGIGVTAGIAVNSCREIVDVENGGDLLEHKLHSTEFLLATVLVGEDEERAI